jgi:hypothetical protein
MDLQDKRHGLQPYMNKDTDYLHAGCPADVPADVAIQSSIDLEAAFPSAHNTAIRQTGDTGGRLYKHPRTV